jgi:type IV secretory pathway VirB6-like protein
MGNGEWSMVNVELWVKEMAMKKSKGGVLFVVGLLAVVGLFGCSQETPAEKAKAAAASGSAAVQAAGQAAVDAIQTPMDQARQTESVLEQSAEQRAAEAKKATE